ncbi:Hypothetical predicted protein [Pelobates cultripes]|uniref:Uncharacterized protein n=1 Tax=Pelobates cultripes TaxID=61616 RepID=A0AAD1R9K3_PELCU|nr:Hypothetical predicted protein [Pelobates cultripes]
MDDFICTPSTQGSCGPPDKMAPGSPSQDSMGDSLPDDTLAQIKQELAMISTHMLTKADSGGLLQELRTAIREELTALRTDLSAVEVRVEALETEAQACRTQHRAAELATTRQGNMLLSLRRQVEDLENRSRRQNIRIRGLPEPDATPLPDTLRALFRQILGQEGPKEIQFDRVHRAQGPQRPDGRPRDVLCCLHTYSTKEKLMAAARGMTSIQFHGSEVSLYQDLSGLTLDARRALRPLTTTLRDKGVPYRWGFPFSLQIKHSTTWLQVRWPDDIPRALRTLRLPNIRVRNWLLDTPLAPRQDPGVDDRPPAPRREEARSPRMWGGPSGAEE